MSTPPLAISTPRSMASPGASIRVFTSNMIRMARACWPWIRTRLDPLQLVHLTDPHFGCEDVEALAAAKRYIAEHHPDAVIVTGDISTDGLQHELDAACEWIRGLDAPVMLTPGNHDVPYY